MSRKISNSDKSWVQVSNDSDFPIQNLPFGVFKKGVNDLPHVGVAIGDKVLDLHALYSFGYLNDLPFGKSDFQNAYLNDMMSHGKKACSELRLRIYDLLHEANTELSSSSEHANHALYNQSDVIMMLPIKVGDYTDFYSSRDHATNVGTMFRDPDNALLPNWLHIPVGYHGRASSIVISGEPVIRPKGQQKPNKDEPPVFGPCKLLDFELEMAFVTFEGKPLGESITTKEADDYIFGMCLFNDWSARDIQTWEYVPLGPFLAKNFASSISPWIVTLDALEQFRLEGPKQEPKVFPYLEYEGNKHIDIKLEVSLTPDGGSENTICKSNYKHMYWNMNQQLAHHTINGCNIKCGDMMASGTISGPTPESYGSMLELSWRGTKPLQLNDGTERKFIQDGDTITMKGYCQNDEIRIGFGEVSSKILPAN
ncbi:fumarylacetoacetase [Paracrocinitomix mangrovi]|uniref:fumarylacetoacetase n=1 Tax=Paracrocinitomix mangrovi TaxID=2862509 RepID=UPI001C8D06E7|nr:fumarylacetoacetase [Paracrocinitomix mangrovi]UKN03005.1 fumarylacetoacetase [Paracrocinitomix mangrovi]